MPTVFEAPLLENEDGAWIMLSRAAEILEMTRQNAHLMAKGGKFASLHRIKGTDMLLVHEAEVINMKLKRGVAVPVADIADPKAPQGVAGHS